MEFHGVDTRTQFKKMRELAPEAFRAFLEFDQKAFKDGAIPGKMKELMALGIAQITQCPWCIQAHTKKAAMAGASDDGDRGDDVRGHGHGRGRGVEPRRPRAAMPAGAQGVRPPSDRRPARRAHRRPTAPAPPVPAASGLSGRASRRRRRGTRRSQPVGRDRRGPAEDPRRHTRERGRCGSPRARRAASPSPPTVRRGPASAPGFHGTRPRTPETPRPGCGSRRRRGPRPGDLQPVLDGPLQHEVAFEPLHRHRKPGAEPAQGLADIQELLADDLSANRHGAPRPARAGRRTARGGGGPYPGSERSCGSRTAPARPRLGT